MAKAAGAAEQQAMMKTEVRCFRRGSDRPSASLGMSQVLKTLCTCRRIVSCVSRVEVRGGGQRDIPPWSSTARIPGTRSHRQNIKIT